MAQPLCLVRRAAGHPNPLNLNYRQVNRLLGGCILDLQPVSLMLTLDDGAEYVLRFFG